MKKLIVSILALAACAFCIVSCNKDNTPTDEDPIVGNWLIEGAPVITGLDTMAQMVIGSYLQAFTFKNDGTIENNPAFTGYVKKGEALMLTFNPEIASALALMYGIDAKLLALLPCNVKIDGNKMTLAAAIYIPQDPTPLDISISANYIKQ